MINHQCNQDCWINNFNDNAQNYQVNCSTDQFDKLMNEQQKNQ